jgi:hypothetical protein
MGNLESAEGGPGEPPSVSLLLPPGKMPMPEPCELEERFALVLVRTEPSPFPLPRPPGSRRPGWDFVPGLVPPTPSARARTDPGLRCLPGDPRAAAGRPGQPRREPRGQRLNRWALRRKVGGEVPSPGPPENPDFSSAHFSLPRRSPRAENSIPETLADGANSETRPVA